MEPEPQTPWVESPRMEIDLDLPMRERFGSVPPETLALGRRLLDAVIAEVPQETRHVAQLIRLRTANRFHAEFRALANAIDVDWRFVTIANVSYDLALAFIGCSTIVLPTADGPVVARNMDWWPEDVLAQCSCLIHYRRSKGAGFYNAGWPGTTGVVTGLSENGFAVVLNAVLGPETVKRTGYPVLLHLRRVLEDATGFDHALEMLSKQKLMVPALITLVGSENDQRVVVERSPTQCALRWGEPGQALVTTNDYRLLFPPEQTSGGAEIYATTCTRFEHLTQAFAGHDPEGEVADAQLLYALTDANVIQGITAQHILMHPRARRVRMFVPRALLER